MRLDKMLFSRSLVRSRTEAQELIVNGHVMVNGVLETKPHKEVGDADLLRVLERLPYVSRGGLKIAKAIEYWHIPVSDKIFLDIGASTGGFTEYLVSHGAKRVYAVDVGTDQLHISLRSNKKVISLEQTDIRTLVSLPEKVDGCVIDVSFISLTHIFPTLSRFLQDGASVVALVKPQFEVGKAHLSKNGIVLDEEKRREALEHMLTEATHASLTIQGEIESPIYGGDGNKEFLLYGIYKHR